MLRFVLNFEFWSFEFVSDFGFLSAVVLADSASDLVAAERSEAAPSSPRLVKYRVNLQYNLVSSCFFARFFYWAITTSLLSMCYETFLPDELFGCG
jgi:hypothetical protein